MLRRSPFKRAAPPSRPARQWEGHEPRPRAIVVVPALQAIVTPLPKECAVQHLGYMRAVRSLSCRRCWTVTVPRQFCHSDEGKGERIKTDCRLGWSGCPPCHFYVGSTGRMSKEGRREFERYASASTRAEIIARDLWPATLPRWGT